MTFLCSRKHAFLIQLFAKLRIITNDKTFIIKINKYRNVIITVCFDFSIFTIGKITNQKWSRLYGNMFDHQFVWQVNVSLKMELKKKLFVFYSLNFVNIVKNTHSMCRCSDTRVFSILCLIYTCRIKLTCFSRITLVFFKYTPKFKFVVKFRYSKGRYFYVRESTPLARIFLTTKNIACLTHSNCVPEKSTFLRHKRYNRLSPNEPKFSQ